jgi:tetratricopeptide (TPR) repeat protein
MAVMIRTLLLMLATLPADAARPPLDEILSQALAHMEASAHQEARREVERALALYPGSPAAHNFLGVIEASEGRPAEAERRFREAIQLDPRYTDAYLNLGRLYQETRGEDPSAARRALDVYQAILEYAPGHAEARFQSAALHQVLGEYDRSLEDLARLGPVDRERPSALAVRLTDHVGRGDREEADRAVETLLAVPGVTEVDLRSVLPALPIHGRQDLAVRVLEALRARGWATAEDLRELGRLHETRGDLAFAREALEAAWGLRPGEVTPLMDLARVAREQGDLRGALGYLAHARSLDPDNAHIHFFFGMVCVDLELGAEADAALQEAVRLDPDNPAINYAMGAVASHRKDPSEAIPYFQRYSELRPDDPRGPFNVGLAAFKAKDYAIARERLLPAAERLETAAPANYYLARIARAELDFEEAKRRALRAVAADPDYADPYSELGLVYLHLGEPEKAERALMRCLELDPDHYLGNLHLGMLYARTRDPRGPAQRERFEAIKKEREEKAVEFLRPIEVRPY